MSALPPSTRDTGPGDPNRDACASLDSILCTEELQRRPSRPPNYEKENGALVTLASALADSPGTVFHALADTILNVTEGDSAGISLLTADGRTPDPCGGWFFWPAIAGMWNPHVGGGTPRHFGPCGDVLAHDRTLLFKHFERRYPYLLPVVPAAEECLLVPFYVRGTAVGTIWAIMHSDRRTFDAEDRRVMGSLGTFASSAYQTLAAIDDLIGVRHYLETGQRRLNWSAAEMIGLRKNGEESPVDTSFAEVANDGPRTFTGFVRDITERRQAEELRAARTRQVAVQADVSAALAADHTLGEILQCCAEAVVKHLDAAFARIWVVTKDERFLALHASAGMYTHVDGAHRLVPVGHLKIGLIAQDRTPLVTNDVITDPRLSDPKWARAEGMVAFAGFPLLAGGKVVGVLAMFSKEPISQGVTETLATISDTLAQGIQRKQAEEAVRRSETFLAAAQALSQTGSWGWNTATGDLFWSRETYRIFGFPADVTPTLRMVADAMHPDDRARFEHDAETLARNHTDFEREYRLTLHDGAIRHVHVVGRFAAQMFPDLDVIGSIMDITERRNAEDALLTTQAELAEVNRRATMGELSASIAHEINQPLATVVTNAQTCVRLLRATPPPWREVEAAVSDIAEAGKRASDVIARIRLLLRKGIFEPVALSVSDVIRDVIALTRETMRQKQVVLDTRLSDDVPRVFADRVQLQQVFVNLITNAADAMSGVTDRPRTLTVSSRCNDGLQVEVAVADAGVGIDPAIRERMFEPFHTTKPDGMGMGLAICRGILDACGGRLWATANVDRGTTFHVVLPTVTTERV